jgi:hypothetical protein
MCSPYGCYEVEGIDSAAVANLPYISVRIKGEIRSGGITVFLAHLAGVKTTQRAIVETFTCAI